MSDLTQIGRLALRVEGDNWCAYYADPTTMEGAIFLGSIRMALVTKNQDRKRAFQAMMTEAVQDVMEELIGERPKMKMRPAPEHERSGRA